MKKKQTNKRLVIFILVLVVVIGVVFLFKAFYVPTKTYHSDFLKITFEYPAKFELEERFGTIILKQKNIEGVIILDAVGTNNNSLAYADKEERIKINNLEAKKYVSMYADYPGKLPIEHVGYQFFKNHTIYSIYTNTSAFHKDLDRIAQSFRYEP